MANLEIEIGAVTSGLDKSLKAAESKLASFSQKATSIGKNLSIAVTAPILAIGAAAIKSASDTEESFSKFDTVFRDVAKSAENSFQTLRKEYGLSSLAAKTLLGDTGDLLTGFGFSQEAALDLSTEVNKLAVDLASFTNFSGGASGASEALTKALLGERESVKALGIAILEEDVQKQIAINTAKGLTFETERQAKAQATLDLAIQQSQNAIGDYARTSDSFANQTRLLQARLSDLASELGKVLLPLATKITKAITAVVERFTDLESSTKRTIVIIAGIAAAIGPLLLAVGSAIKLLPILAGGIGGLKVALAALTGPIGLAVVAVGALGIAIFKNWDKIKETLDNSGITKIINELVQNFKDFASIIVNELKDAFDSFKTNVIALFEVLKPVGLFIADSLIKTFKAFAEVVSQSFGFIVDLVQGDFSSAFIRLETIFLTLAKTVIRAFKPILDFVGIGGKLEGVIDSINGKIANNKAVLAGRAAFESYNKEVKETNKELQKTGEIIEGLGGGAFDSGINRSQSTAIDGSGERTPGQFAGLDTSGAGIVIPPISQESKTAFLESLTQFKENASQILTGGISNVIGDFAFSIGEAIGSGANVVETVGATLLKGIAQIANQLGQAAIGIGISMIAIKKAFSNPFTAIAAGAALVALAGVISSQVPKITQGGGGGGAGGVTGGAGQSFQGSGTNNALVDSFGALEITGQSKIEGTDIIISYEKAQRANGR